MATVWSKKSFKEKEEDKDVTSSNSTTSLLNIMETQKVRYFFNFHLLILNAKNVSPYSTKSGYTFFKDQLPVAGIIKYCSPLAS